MEKNNRDYTNGEITVFWRPAHCTHATICFTELRAVFDPRKRPWVNMSGASTEEIIEVVNLCPTKALTFKWNDPEKNRQETSHKVVKDEEATAPTSKDNASFDGAKAKLVHNGPLLLSGNFKLFDSTGEEMKTMKMVSICRCGGSKNKPFCDGTHTTIKFEAD